MVRIRNGEAVSPIETLRNTKDGAILDVSVTVSPIIDDNGTVIGASTIARDITRSKAEERLKELEEKYQSVVENIAVGVYRSTGDPRGKFLWGNPALVRILGYPTFESLEDVAVAEIFVEPDGREKFLRELKSAGFVKNKEIRLKKPDGSRITVLVTALVKLGDDGAIKYINGLVEDITDRMRTEQQMQVIQKELIDIVELLPFPMFLIDNDKNVVAWNRALEELTGVLAGRVIGTGEYARSFPFYGMARPLLIDLIDAPDSDIEHYYSNLKREGEVLEAETFCPTLNGGKGLTLWAKAAPLTDYSGSRIGAIEIIEERDGTTILHSLTAAAPGRSGAFTPGPVRAYPHSGASHPNIPVLLSRLYLSNALKSAHDGITILDLSAHCIWANDALVSLLGVHDSDAVVGKSVTEFIAGELRGSVLERLTGLSREGPARFPIEVITPQGMVSADTSVSCIADEEGDLLGYLAIFRRAPE